VFKKYEGLILNRVHYVKLLVARVFLVRIFLFKPNFNQMANPK